MRLRALTCRAVAAAGLAQHERTGVACDLGRPIRRRAIDDDHRSDRPLRPAATAAANDYHDHMRDGLLGMLGGMVAMIGGVTYLTAEAVDDPNGTRHDFTVPIVVTLGGAVIMMVGAGYLAGAEPYRWDAIN